MSDLIISFVATAVFCLIIGAAIFVVDWLIGIFGTTVIIPICFFVLIWACAYCALQE